MKYGIVFGGQSYEHEISIVSAIVLKGILNNSIFIFCSKDREFFLIEPENMKAVFFSSGKYKKCNTLILKNGGFYQKKLIGESLLEVDSFINLIHGADGEDGKIASLFDFYKIKYIGPRIEASVMSFNKKLTKLLADSVGVKTLNYQVLRRQDDIKIDFPIILKPLRLGSSIGVSVVKDQSELEYALDVAFEFDDEILVEPFISNVKEYNLAGTKANGEFIYSIIEEPAKKEFLDYEQKYIGFSSDKTSKSADISDKIASLMRDSFNRIYNFGFDGALIRCDFFVIDDDVYLNEINPNPGSLANYLFDDFLSVLSKLSQSLPECRKINIDYSFIHSITKSKGSKLS